MVDFALKKTWKLYKSKRPPFNPEATMTWKEFKDAVEKQGVLDTDGIWSIDFYTNVVSEGIVVHKDEIDGVVITDCDDEADSEEIYDDV